ncbi:leucine-rich repeat protein [Novymonas esmeraldas]|uniref:Leucine-rich repeat protein n=1 Tax=Novymonas esmeraldas TaxID=1808958 RepID=A0AAW0EXB0_9TRYP
MDVNGYLIALSDACRGPTVSLRLSRRAGSFLYHLLHRLCLDFFPLLAHSPIATQHRRSQSNRQEQHQKYPLPSSFPARLPPPPSSLLFFFVVRIVQRISPTKARLPSSFPLSFSLSLSLFPRPQERPWLLQRKGNSRITRAYHLVSAPFSPPSPPSLPPFLPISLWERELVVKHCVAAKMPTRPTRRGMGPFGAMKPGGVRMNRKDLRSVREVTVDHYDAEYMYLRENQLISFDCDVKMEYLRVLDLSINEIGGAVNFLKRTPYLHHLYMTGNKIDTLAGISNFAAIETLCLSDNAISSFAGLENLPNLRVLSLNFNNITSFESYPALPNLHTLNLVGNPITDAPNYRPMAIAVNGLHLISVDGNPVQVEERAEADKYKGKVAHCVREGFTVEGENPEEAAAAFMVKMQRNRQDAKYLQLCSINLASVAEDSDIVEGEPVALSLCMQDVRPYAQRTTEVFQSSYLYPVIFKVSGEASEVFVVGSMNNWTEPISLERCVESDEVYFHTTLYLPAGDYEYRYIVDGVEKVSEANSMPSKYKQGFCNIYKVAELEPQEEEQDTILHIRWMRSSPSGSYEVIEDENTLTYTPTTADVDCCLRVEVLAYVNGEFSFLYFDISTPIKPAPPQCPRLEVTGVAMEGGMLSAEADYLGGVEGNSSLVWYRISANGEEAIVDIADPWAGYEVTREDIGCRIRAEFTPVRNDWAAGEPKSVTTDPVTACTPECRSIKIIGSLAEGSQLEVDVEYYGGEEGDSFYQWLRKAGSKDDYTPISGANGTKYVATPEDVGQCLAVEYTPVNAEGVAGETCRCVLDNPIEAAGPTVSQLTIVGELTEQHTLTLEYDYAGGQSGAHMIQWYRRDKKRSHMTKIGAPNSNFVTLTSKDVGSSIEVSLTPVRRDGVTGKVVTASRDGAVEPCAPEVKLLNIAGEPVVGRELTLQVEYCGGTEGESIATWEVEDPDTEVFNIVAKDARSYTVKPGDAGKMIRVTYTPIRSDGFMGAPRTRMVQVKGQVPSQVPATAPAAARHVDAAAAASPSSPSAPAQSPAKAPAKVATPKTATPAPTPKAATPKAASPKAATPAPTPKVATPSPTPRPTPKPTPKPTPRGDGKIRIKAKTHDSDDDSDA